MELYIICCCCCFIRKWKINFESRQSDKRAWLYRSLGSLCNRKKTTTKIENATVRNLKKWIQCRKIFVCCLFFKNSIVLHQNKSVIHTMIMWCIYSFLLQSWFVFIFLSLLLFNFFSALFLHKRIVLNYKTKKSNHDIVEWLLPYTHIAFSGCCFKFLWSLADISFLTFLSFYFN